MSQLSNRDKSLIAGFALIVLVSCAAAFPYKHYVINLEEQKLQGPEPKDDLPLSICSKGAEGYSCTMMKIDDMINLKSDYQTKAARLEILEKKCGDSN